MKKNKSISENVLRRLPKYYRILKELEEENVKKISSTAISKMLSFTASQVRQDLSNFGEFGHQGYGYDVVYLKEQINNILGLNKVHNVIVVGGGRIGQALANYRGFKEEGFAVLAVFDIKTDGINVGEGIKVLHMSQLEEFLKYNNVEVCVIATQKEVAKYVAEQVKALGIKSFWNFAPCDLSLGADVAVENINMSESLFMLAYKNKNLSKDKRN
jgi:redox-sensing transcriptional repressor